MSVGAGMAAAQTPELHLSLHRDNGYGGPHNDIQGKFSFRVSGPDTLTRVEFYIDEQRIGQVEQAPWKLRFVTDDYAQGPHTLSAIGYTAAGEALSSNTVQANFVPAVEAFIFLAKYVLPLLLVITVIPLLLCRRQRRLHPERYSAYSGAFGGAICPNCGCPYPRHWWGLNFVSKKYDRCPHCGQWSLVGRESIEDLRTAATNCGLPPEDDDFGRQSLIRD